MIYVDHAATTPCDKRVLDKMMPYFTDIYGNSGSKHSFGRNASQAVNQARAVIASNINASESEVYFTSGGTEGDNWLLKSSAFYGLKNGRNKVIISCVEHNAILVPAEWLRNHGFEVISLPVDSYGEVQVDSLEKVIDDKVAVVSVMLINNEVGTVQPVKQLAEVAHKYGALFHTDCVQAIPHIKIDVKDLDVDMITISSHKFNGPKGVGAVYIRNGVDIDSFVHGGAQEFGKRGGTLNTAGIVGMGEALRLTSLTLDDDSAYVCKLRKYFIDKVLTAIDDCRLNGKYEEGVSGIANIGFRNVNAGLLVNLMDNCGVAVSTGATCAVGSVDAHVLHAMGVPSEYGSLRFSFGADNTYDEIDTIVKYLVENVQKLRCVDLFGNNGGSVHCV